MADWQQPEHGIDWEFPAGQIPVAMERVFMGGRGRARWDPAETVAIGDRRRVPREILVYLNRGRDRPSVNLKMEVCDGVPRWTEVAFRARPDGAEIRNRDLSALRLTDLLHDVTALASSSVDQAGRSSKPAADRLARKHVRDALAGSPRTMTAGHLRTVAKVYRDNIAEQPTQAVARAFDVPHRTAARWVARAREAGQLPPTRPGQKKA